MSFRTRGSTVGALPNENKKNRDVAQLGSAPCSGRGGRKFESCHPDFFYIQNKDIDYTKTKRPKLKISFGLLNKWSERQDLNLRPLPPQGSALPSCATSRLYLGSFSGLAQLCCFLFSKVTFSHFCVGRVSRIHYLFNFQIT